MSNLISLAREGGSPERLKAGAEITPGLRGVRLRGEPVSGLQREHARLSPAMQAHVSLHTYPTNENTTSAYGAEKHWASAAINTLALDCGLFSPDLSINSVLTLYSILPLQTFM